MTIANVLKPWTIANIGDQRGKIVLITGANTGIGFHVAKALGQAGATVILACRNEAKGLEAVQKLTKLVKEKNTAEGTFELRLVDLTSLKDVERFATEFNKEGRPIDILINNAGIMMPPYEKTVDGFESQLAANYLGHFVLTEMLMPSLKLSAGRAPAAYGCPRVVSVSSIIAWRAKKYDQIDFVKDGGEGNNNFNSAGSSKKGMSPGNKNRFYNAPETYAESKLAALLFMKELGRRYPNIISVAAHPGVSASNLHQHSFHKLMWAMQGVETGALPIIRAAVDPSARSGNYYAPRGSYAGLPTYGLLPPLARNSQYAKQYWDATVAAVGPKLEKPPAPKSNSSLANEPRRPLRSKL